MNIELIKAFHCPRWSELPKIPLYMDQVIYVIEGSLSAFAEEEHVITSTMIGNYVKHKVIPAPVNKKYTDEQLAMLIMITLLKKVFSISEITGLINAVAAEGTLNEAYDKFCDEFEQSVKSALFGDEYEVKIELAKSKAEIAGRAAIAALTGYILACKTIAETQETLEK